MSRPICPYCQNEALRVTGDKLYPRRADLHTKTFYACPPCHAYVGCHPGTDRPLGALANQSLRRWRNRAHFAFDPLWKGTGAPLSRTEAYRWLAGELGIKGEDCHIGLFDEDACRRTVEISRAPRFNYQPEKRHGT